MVDAHSLTGQVLGSYRVLERIDKGGFGYVYKGQHTLLGTIVAMKVLHSSYGVSDAHSRAMATQLLQEAQTHQKLRHPFILPLLDVGEIPSGDQEEGMLYMVMEYAPGGSLHTRLDQQGGQPLPLQEALTILWQVGQALHYAHSHPEGTIVHRDVKPKNILFNARGDPLIADFGLATELAAGQTTSVDKGGSPPYMSPEQFEGRVSVKSDQYALGCIAYEVLTGQSPFPGGGNAAWWFQHKTMQPEDPRTYNAQVPAYTSQAILRALAKNHTERYDTVLQFVEALRGTSSRRSFNEWYQQGQCTYDQGNFTAALAAFQEVCLLHPTFANAHFNKGLALHQLQRYTQASAAFEQAITCDPTAVTFYVQAGITFSQRGLFAEAVQMYQRAVLMEAQHTKAWELLADAYYALKQYREAVEAYKRALGLQVSAAPHRATLVGRHDPGRARTYMNLGLASKYARQNNEALAAFECAIDLDPGLKQAYYNKGNLLAVCGLHQLAVQAFDKALQIDPLYLSAYRAKGGALRSLGLLDEARQAEELARRLDQQGR